MVKFKIARFGDVQCIQDGIYRTANSTKHEAERVPPRLRHNDVESPDSCAWFLPPTSSLASKAFVVLAFALLDIFSSCFVEVTFVWATSVVKSSGRPFGDWRACASSGVRGMVQEQEICSLSQG